MRHNKFSDWTDQERKSILGLRKEDERFIYKPHHEAKLGAFWIFGSCDEGEYKSWLGCKPCDTGCGSCSGGLFLLKNALRARIRVASS